MNNYRKKKRRNQSKIIQIHQEIQRFFLGSIYENIPDLEEKMRTCADQIVSQQILKAECQGQRTCKVEVNAETFGDPCEGLDEFLEVQFQCIQQEKYSNEPRFKDHNIASMWNDFDSTPFFNKIIFEKIELVNIPRRVPITESPTVNTFMELKDERTPSKTNAPNESQQIIMISTMTCFFMLPIIVTLTIIIIRSKSSSHQQTHEIREVQYPCLVRTGPSMGVKSIFIKQDSSKSKKFYSEPNLIRHQCLLS